MELFHVFNRGVEKINVVRDDNDRLRFIHDLFVMNNREQVDPNHRFREFHQAPGEREPLVVIYAYCLMNNHYHLLLSEFADNGIAAFMRKLNMGYSKYFNEKYKRSGLLWQGRYQKKLVEREHHFLHIPFYIHLNPLDYQFPEWRGGRVKNSRRAFEYLKKYRWSSYLDYVGISNFPSLIEMPLLTDVLGSQKRQERIMSDIISTPRLAHESLVIET